jgi:hypothetical protein
MTEPNRDPAEQPAASPERDPLGVTDLPENETDATDVKGGGLSTGSGLAPTASQACAPSSASCLPNSNFCSSSSQCRM